MSKMSLKNSRIISELESPYIVAEVNTSHFGDMNIAKDMITTAKKIGCDCVKFQSWSAESLYSKTFYDENPIANRMVKKFSFSEEELTEVASFCKELEIDFSSTPYSREEVDFLANKCQAPFIKIASMELNNYQYIRYIAETGTPIVLSTGMGDLEEIKKAVATIEETGNKNICILHCISIYPPELSTIRLKNIEGLKETFPQYPIGFSDHSLGIEMPSAAIALGAALIEKHFTLDKKRIGMDNQIALEPDEMAEMVKNCRNVHTALGGKERIVPPAEIEQRQKMRRSIIVTRNLEKGTQLSLQDLDTKRPGTGISPIEIENLIGKTLNKDKEADTILKEEDLD